MVNLSRFTSASPFSFSKLFVRSQPASSRIMLGIAVQVSPCTAALVRSVLPVPRSCQPRRLHRVNLSHPVPRCAPALEINIRNDVIPCKRGYSTGVLSHREGREGKEEWWSQFGSDLSQSGFISLHTHPNDHAHPVPSKHDAYIRNGQPVQVHIRIAFFLFQTLRAVSTCLQQDNALDSCAGVPLHSCTG